MSKKYYDIILYEDENCVSWQLLEDAVEYHHATVVAYGKAESMFEAFNAASKERNKYIGEKNL